ncbi:hypothetical protein LCGC14_2062840 [marine sediment metagenome]|uniref:Uncharacterized protein n=1 Tax=marine sediment metagenome TaxID=412755 RepID=A0A0F9EKJ1_9ZZZZ
MIIKRLALVLLLVWGCSFTGPLLRPNKGYVEFIARADIMVEKNFPEWYVDGTPYIINLEETEHLAATFVYRNGVFSIVLYKDALNFTLVEDLATTLLHEHVHVKTWDYLKETIPGKLCNNAVSELMAYGVELEQTKIQVSQTMRDSTQFWYEEYYLYGSVVCPAEIIKDFPNPFMLNNN